MYKKILSILMIVTIFLFLSGCGDIIVMEPNMTEDGSKDLPYVIKNQDGISLVSNEYELSSGESVWFRIEPSRLSTIDPSYKEINYILLTSNGEQVSQDKVTFKTYKRDKNSTIKSSLVEGTISVYEYVPGLSDEIYYVQVTMLNEKGSVGITLHSEIPEVNVTTEEVPVNVPIE